MQQESVNRCWQEFVSGDRNSFKKVYEFYRPILNFYCLGKLKDAELAERFSSESLIKAFNHPDPITIREIDKWLFTTAKNLCITHFRTSERRAEILASISPDPGSNFHSDIDHKHNYEEIDYMIKQALDESEYELWQLHVSGYDNEEIAEKFGMKPKTIANKKSEIRNRLKELIGKNRINKEK